MTHLNQRTTSARVFRGTIAANENTHTSPTAVQHIAIIEPPPSPGHNIDPFTTASKGFPCKHCIDSIRSKMSLHIRIKCLHTRQLNSTQHRSHSSARSLSRTKHTSHFNLNSSSSTTSPARKKQETNLIRLDIHRLFIRVGTIGVSLLPPGRYPARCDTLPAAQRLDHDLSPDTLRL